MMLDERARLRWLAFVTLGLVILEAGILWGAVQLARAGSVVPDALWILAVLTLGAIVLVASRLRS